MSRKAKGWLIVAVVLVLAAAGVGIWWEVNHGNRQLMDFQNRFDRAVLRLPNGEIVEGKVDSWLDFSDSDVLQVKINGVTYLTHYSNICLIND